MRDVVSPAQYAAARLVFERMALYRRSEDLITLGAYKAGTSKELDKAVAAHDDITAFLRQEIRQPIPYARAVDELTALAQRIQ
jgi:flagellum-specific ATP synthase